MLNFGFFSFFLHVFTDWLKMDASNRSPCMDIKNDTI